LTLENVEASELVNLEPASEESRTDAKQETTCEVRVEEAGPEQVGAFEVGLPQY
jgi:hypothetical protein